MGLRRSKEYHTPMSDHNDYEVNLQEPPDSYGNRHGGQNIYNSGKTLARLEFEKWLAQAKNGDPTAQFNVALCYDRGDGVSHSSAEAIKWYKVAAENGHSRAQYNLGYSYMHGDGVAPDFELAEKWLTASADQGNEKAMHLLCDLYMSIGPDPGNEDLVYWMEKLASDGDIDMMYNLAGLLDGFDDELSLKYLIDASDGGQPYAQFLLAMRYESGDMVERSTAKAEELYRKAAQKGVTKELMEEQFGMVSEPHPDKGERIPELDELLSKYQAPALLMGDVDAQLILAKAFIKYGYLGDAVEFLSMAADRGSEEAEDLLDKIYSR